MLNAVSNSGHLIHLNEINRINIFKVFGILTIPSSVAKKSILELYSDSTLFLTKSLVDLAIKELEKSS